MINCNVQLQQMLGVISGSLTLGFQAIVVSKQQPYFLCLHAFEATYVHAQVTSCVLLIQQALVKSRQAT